MTPSSVPPAPTPSARPTAATCPTTRWPWPWHRLLEGRDLLSHPFYQRWQAGELAPEELAEYAVHYRAFEAALPVVLTAVVDQLRDGG